MISISEKSQRSFSRARARVTVSCVPIQKTGGTIDTSRKYYEKQNVEGFTIMSEPGRHATSGEVNALHSF